MLKIYPWQQSTWDKFAHAQRENHLPHALLLSGESGIGKLHFADAMVKSLLCLSPESNEHNYVACDNCQGCKTYESKANPDFLNIELLAGKQQIAVDQVREISDFLSYTSSFNGTRVILLNPIERMNKNAANSLLKSLEEPSKNTVLILVTSNLSQIMPTIMSRCQLLSVTSPTHKQSLEWLKVHSQDKNNLESSLLLANGKPLHAINISEEMIKSREELGVDVLSILDEHKSITEVAKKWEKFDLVTLLDWQISWVQDFIKNKNSLSDIQSKIKGKTSTEQQWTLYQHLIGQKRLVHTSVNPLIFLENMLISWIQVKS